MMENSTTVLSGILKSFDGRTEAIAQPRIEPESSLENGLESTETPRKTEGRYRMQNCHYLVFSSECFFLMTGTSSSFASFCLTMCLTPTDFPSEKSLASRASEQRQSRYSGTVPRWKNLKRGYVYKQILRIRRKMHCCFTLNQAERES